MTLLEVVVAITIVTVILGLTTRFLQVIQSAERDLRSETKLLVTINDLGPQLRTDIRNSKRAEIGGERADTLLLLRDEASETVKYQLLDGAIERTTDDPTSRRREFFRIPGDWKRLWEVTDGEAKLVVQLQNQRSSRFSSPLERMEISARLGQDAARVYRKTETTP